MERKNIHFTLDSRYKGLIHQVNFSVDKVTNLTKLNEYQFLKYILRPKINQVFKSPLPATSTLNSTTSSALLHV